MLQVGDEGLAAAEDVSDLVNVQVKHRRREFRINYVVDERRGDVGPLVK